MSSPVPVRPILTLQGATDHITGYAYFWLKYVTGFDPSHHCAKALKGTYDTRIGGRIRFTSDLARCNVPMVLDEAPVPDAYYLMGNTGTWKHNLHVAFVLEPGATFTHETHHGYRVIVEHGRRLPIPPLPRGWRSLPDAFTTCRNFQFGVSFFGADGA